MSNKGTISGASAAQWRDYDPVLLGTNTLGNPTMPALGNSTVRGRYLRLTAGLVVAQTQFVFGSTFTGGDADAWIISLPFPAHRWTSTMSSATADLPIGTALGWQGSAASPSLTMPFLPTLADPLAGYNQQTNEDYYAHLFCAHHISSGTGSISGTNTSTTITHNLPVTPVASDIVITPTALTSAATNLRLIYVDTITSTQFNVNTSVAPGTSKTLSFSWKARAEPNNTSTDLPQLVSYNKPWVWDDNHGIFCQFIYEARF